MHRIWIEWVGLACATVVLGCAASRPAIPSTVDAQTTGSPDVVFEPVQAGVWLHRSVMHIPGYGDVPANGLVVKTSSGGLIIDTAWTPEQTAVVLDWAAEHVGPVRAVLVTHWHNDRTGGLPEVHRRGIPTYGSRRTAQLAGEHDAPTPSHPFEGTFDLADLGVQGEAHFAGAGHSLDNVVVWLADSRVLFGGCLVKSGQAEGLGNTADADLRAWPHTIAQVQARYPNAAIVIPGHGPHGGIDLLSHTRSLLAR
ncbi:MAG: subclass B1 metallo-beta-lactamase [Myxococcales bacterium]|nr:subclass B1 metallo-beta-lactamase [Myxococcales bacterium]MDD9968567.1 subclass B1 metallo-beta-lactamase [Myxococcales bacterium]